jgi:predicted DNA-binding transcriptional regulator YafY
MDIEKIYKLHDFLRGRRSVATASQMAEHLKCSERNVARYIKFMRHQLNAPLDFDGEYKGYKYSNDRYELPGLWLNADEILALTSLQKLMGDLGEGLLDQQLSTLKNRIDSLLQTKHLGNGEMNRVKLLPMLARELHQPIFQTVSSALLQRKQLNISYHARGDNTHSARTVSPQHLVHYRDNWHLDGWCHTKQALRTFALDCILSAQINETPAKGIANEVLEAHFASGYGIFAGHAEHTAIIRFTPERARWVSGERWHPQQQTEWLDDGSYQLHIPYSDPRELMMDIMRHLPDVEVIAPESLKHAIFRRLEAALQKYSK